MRYFRNKQREREWHRFIFERDFDAKEINKFADEAGEPFVRWLFEQLRSFRNWKRKRAGEALTLLKTPLVEQLLLEDLEIHIGNWRSRPHIIELIKLHCSPQLIEQLITWVNSPKKSLATGALIALVELEAVEAEEAIVEACRKRYLGETLQMFYNFMKVMLIAFCIGFVGRPIAILTGLDISSIPSFFFILPILATVRFGRRWWQFRTLAIKAMEKFQTPSSLGVLALSAQDQVFTGESLLAIVEVLKRINQEKHEMYLSAHEMKALARLLKLKDEQLRLSLIEAFQYLGDEIALKALNELIESKEASQVLKDAAAKSIPLVEQRIERLKSERLLLRSADLDADHDRLLRAADGIEDAAEEQLLRKSDRIN